MKKIALFSLVILVFTSSCREIAGRRVRGSGNIITQNRTESGFNSIDVSGAIDVYIKQDSTTSVKVEADDNILEYIEVHTSGSTLEIYTENNIRLKPSQKIKVYVSNPEYRNLQISGASSIHAENEITSSEALHIEISGASEGRLDVNAPKVSVNLTGASNVNIKGKTKDFEGGASGASEIRGFDLLSENADVDASGASHIEIFASVKIAGQSSGASSVDYKGNAQANVDKSGASSVNKKD
ncbi:MAG TPA: head GIN domain-containing protein [Chitinophagaceae bacterium]|jgi:carbon monoxide dehydrogenase subunit G|nr:head GIN domain-containing protein [Chitinophagaceae bacterium]